MATMSGQSWIEDLFEGRRSLIDHRVGYICDTDNTPTETPKDRTIRLLRRKWRNFNNEAEQRQSLAVNLTENFPRNEW